MVDEKMYEALAKVRDSFYGAATALDELIQQASKVVLREYDVSKIPWRPSSGPRGSFELCDAKENKANTEYLALLGHLKEKNGTISRDNYFYWLFQDNETIGRKPQKKA